MYSAISISWQDQCNLWADQVFNKCCSVNIHNHAAVGWLSNGSSSYLGCKFQWLLTYARRRQCKFTIVCLSICLFVCQQDYGKSFQTVFFMKPCRIMDYCYGTNPLNFGVNPPGYGRLAAILDFWCMTLVVLSSEYVGLWL